MEKHAAVVGADSALGKEIVAALRSEGYIVHQTVLNKPADPSTRANTAIHTTILDITDHAACKTFVTGLPQLAFFTCAAAKAPRVDRFEKFKLAEFDEDWQVNVRAQIGLVQELLTAGKLLAQSNLIFIASEVVVDDLLSYCAPYSVSKHALLGVMRALSVELKARQIFVNAISPGLMDTPFLKNVPSLVKTKYLQNTGRKAFVTPTEVAQQVIQITNSKESGKNIQCF